MHSLLLQGCLDTCAGAACAVLYGSADLRLFSGATLPPGEVAPTGAGGTISGSEDAGNDWSLAPADGALLVGIPGLDGVRNYDLLAFTSTSSLVTGASATLTGPVVGERFGAGVAFLGGHRAIGAPARTPAPSRGGAGGVYLYDADANLLATLDGEAAEDRLGSLLAACGDLDDDGQADWAATAPWAAALAGRVVVGSGATGATFAEIDGETPSGRFGAVVSCDKAVLGSGTPDVVIGTPFDSVDDLDAAGTVSIYGARRLGGAAFRKLRADEPEADAWFGGSVDVGDLDGDDVADVAVGAEGAGGGLGRVYVYRGIGIVSAAPGGRGPLADAVIEGTAEAGRLGTEVLFADLDGDGRDSLVVGAPGVDPSGQGTAVQSGAAYVFEPDRLTGTLSDTDADTTIVEAGQYLRTGERMTATDLDADGAADLFILNRARSR